jgi:hypothetical protein
MDQTTTPPPPPATKDRPDYNINADFARNLLAATFETMRVRPDEDPSHPRPPPTPRSLRCTRAIRSN